MIAVLLILIPFIGGLLLFAVKNDNIAKGIAFFASLLLVAASVLGLTVMKDPQYLSCNVQWLPMLNSNFHIGLDGMGQLLCLLTALSFPLIFLACRNTSY